MKITKPVLFISDVDGVLTDGSFIYSSQGKIYKTFGAHDADGVRLLKSNNIELEFISADKRGFPITEKRIQDMNCKLTYVSEEDRLNYIKEKQKQYFVVFMGDGICDLPALEQSDISIAPLNARIELLESKDVSFVTDSNGGEGAFLDASIYVVEKIKRMKKL